MGYAENRYSTNKQIAMPATGALNGTRAAAVELSRMTFMHNATVTDANAYLSAGGTQANISILVGKSLGGTGATSAIGTVALGTNASKSVVDGSVTSTDFANGDDLVIQVALGTATTVPNAIPYVNFKEHFVSE